MTMSALQQILAGKKSPQSTQPSSPAAATPVAAGAASAPLPSTPAPAPAAAPSPASSAPLPAPVPGSPPTPGPNAAAVATPQGGPQDTLAALLGDFQANAGKMPQVNPPEAPKVLAGPTALEVAGHPEPEPVKEAQPAPVEKPADVLAAEQAKKARRTAAVVQAELDLALARIAELEAAKPAVQVAVDVSDADGVQTALAEAVEMIQDLQTESKVQAEDNAKAWYRVTQVEAERDAALAQVAAQAPAVAALVDAQPMTLSQAINLVKFAMPPGCSVTIQADAK
jgi:hypothetical protein